MNNYLKPILNIFNLTLIDINKDEVSLLNYQNELTVTEKFSYEEFYLRCKKSIHPDYINLYFDKISINNLENVDYTIVNYLKLSNLLSYDNYTDIVKPLEDNKIILISFKNEKKVSTNINSNNNELSDDVTELIMNIENTLESINKDNYEINNLYNYFSSLVEDLIHKNPQINKSYESKLVNIVNNVSSSLLIVDDDDLTRSIFKKAFSNFYNIMEAKNGEEAVELINNTLTNVDSNNIVGMFLDLKMPVMDGFGVLDYLKEKRLLGKLPVIIVSADDSKDTKEKVYTYEIADMIEKPFNFEIIVKRVNNMIKMYTKNNSINEIIKSQDKVLKKFLNNYINAYLVDNENVYNIASKVIEKLLIKYESEVDVNSLLLASKYYDIGLKTVPYKYFANLNNLSDKEKDSIYLYPKIGSEIIRFADLDDKVYNYAVNIISLHNERFDGKGFPNGTLGKDIPFYVYIVNIGYEYANGIIHGSAKENILNQIKSKSGAKYDPNIISLFESISGEL